MQLEVMVEVCWRACVCVCTVCWMGCAVLQLCAAKAAQRYGTCYLCNRDREWRWDSIIDYYICLPRYWLEQLDGGKTVFCIKLIEQVENVICPLPERVSCFYSQ